jgi:hypothetical protein
MMIPEALSSDHHRLRLSSVESLLVGENTAIITYDVPVLAI